MFNLKKLSVMEMDLEAFLRRHFGLKGEFYSDEFERAKKAGDGAIMAILEEKGPAGLYSEEAWAAWEKAIALVDDLEAAGVISEDAAAGVRCWFCDNA